MAEEALQDRNYVPVLLLLDESEGIVNARAEDKKLKILNYVWNPTTLQWERMQQPYLETHGNIYLEVDEVEELLAQVRDRLPLGQYVTNDVDDVTVADVIFVGKETKGGEEWLIIKMDLSSGMSVRYATQKNNPSFTSYSAAWPQRTSLTFDTYGEVFS